MVRVDMSSNLDTLTPATGVADVAPVASVEPLTDENPPKPEPLVELPSSATATPEEYVALVEERLRAEAHLATEPLMLLDLAVHEGTVQAQKLVEKYAVEQAAEDAARDKAGTTRADHDAITREVAARRADEDAAALQRINQRADNEAADAITRGIVADTADHYEAAQSAASARAADEATAQQRVIDRANEDAAVEAAEAATKPHLDVKA
jgi:hypothetical protein